MDSPKPGLDLERELTCSICTELLYQPLTLLDCLHTFCGACLKEWFSFQAATAQRSPSPPGPLSVVFTCPSCRASVRDTRHNATVVTLLDMVIAANPEKARSEADKQDMAAKYTPGDQVIPKLRIRERTVEERRADEEDRRLVEQVREASLRDASGTSTPPRSHRHRQSRSADGRARTSRDRSADGHTRHRREGSRRRPTEDWVRGSTDQLQPESERRRRRRSESRHRRQVEHQSSLRSLISSADMTERDVEREIEDFARQIQEEGLLDGLDLDNIDLTRDDDLSRKITEAYRRRQRDRPRHESSSRRNHGGQTSSPRPQDQSHNEPRHLAPTGSGRPPSRPRRQSRSGSLTSQEQDRTRPPVSMSAALDDSSRRPRHRASSASRSSTAPIPASNAEPRPTTRSQTDLSVRTISSDPPTTRPSIDEHRSSSTPSMPSGSQVPPQPAAASDANPSRTSFANRATQAFPPVSQTSAYPEPLNTSRSPNHSRSPSAHRPADLSIVHSTITSPVGTQLSPGHHRTRSQLYPEPSISCARCGKSHIEYDVHFNCTECSSGNWNICLDCYRRGRGCQYWFGFGYTAWTKWERLRQQQGKDSMPQPHMLTASRYVAPPSKPGGAEGRKTLTTDDPRRRLETGTFCVRCSAWTNDCYWRCDVCNEGDWGFCNNCVNQGRSCSHMLLPLSHEASKGPGRPVTPNSPGRPPAATILTGPSTSSIGPFKPLTFTTRCDVCQDPIPPFKVRYHCFSCTSSLVKKALPGDYDICSDCYVNLVSRGQISEENGYTGWRRCLRGHRMAVVGFAEGNIGQWRYVDRDIVGGRALWVEAHESAGGGRRLQKWTWEDGDQEFQRLVTLEVAETAPTAEAGMNVAVHFPPDGGTGFRGKAKWAWYPQGGVSNELMFPRGAEIREVKDMNGDWFFGTYMDGKGVFPAPYVTLENGVPADAGTR